MQEAVSAHSTGRTERDNATFIAHAEPAPNPPISARGNHIGAMIVPFPRHVPDLPWPQNLFVDADIDGEA